MSGHLRLHNYLLCAAVTLLFVAFASPVQAAPGGTPGSEGNIVQCGNTPATMCTLCDLYVLVRRVTNYLLFAFALPVAVIALLIGGILLLTSGGSPDKIKRGHAAIYNAVLGLILAFAAWLLINTVAQTFLFKVPFTTGIKQWFDIPKCQAPIVSQGPDKGYCVDASGNSITNCKIISCAACKGDGGTCTQTTPKNCEKVYCVDEQGKSINNCKIIDCAACKGDGGTCQTDRPPSCGIVGTCPLAPSGNACSPDELKKTCDFGGDLNSASQICYRESKGVADIPCGSAIDQTPSGEPVCFGLFQIHLVNTIDGKDCSKSLKKSGNPQHPWEIANRDIYNECKALAQQVGPNVRTACQIKQTYGWSSTASWKNSADACNIP